MSSPIAPSRAHPPATGSSPGLFQMIRMYETCVRIREVSRHQLTLTEDMGLIALNAEIAASKSSDNRAAFRILASESGKIARQMSEHVTQVLADANSLSQNALVGVIKARRLEKMALALEEVRGAANSQRVEDVTTTLRDGISSLLERIRQNQARVDDGRQALGRQQLRVSRIVTYFRIEASRDAEHGDFFRNIADDLTSHISQAESVSRNLRHILASAH